MLKYFLNAWSILIARVLNNLEDSEKAEAQDALRDWMDICRDNDALDGVVDQENGCKPRPLGRL